MSLTFSCLSQDQYLKINNKKDINLLETVKNKIKQGWIFIVLPCKHDVIDSEKLGDKILFVLSDHLKQKYTAIVKAKAGIYEIF
jgi:hypothetical protein